MWGGLYDLNDFLKLLTVPQTSGVAASSLMGVDDVTVKATSDDVRDAAAATLSKLRVLILKLHKL